MARRNIPTSERRGIIIMEEEKQKQIDDACANCGHSQINHCALMANCVMKGCKCKRFERK